jgi:hypothetical protein
MQQLREATPADHTYSFLIHDRDAIFSQDLDQGVGHMELRVLKTPPQSPQANAICERLLGTLRREYLDSVIRFTENHLRRFIQQWVQHYNAGRPHMSLGPGIPSRPRHCRCRYKHIGIGFPSMRVWWRMQSWATCILNTDLQRKQHDKIFADHRCRLRR